MHGYYKMLTEGYRTRDAHILEWLSLNLDAVETLDVYSRPEPFPLVATRLALRRRERLLPRTRDITPSVLRVPNLRNTRRWWVDSTPYYPPPSAPTASIVWNPMVAKSPKLLQYFDESPFPVHFDLLDDWSIHGAFVDIKDDVENAYSTMFRIATSVSANSEGTLRLAHRFGRTDAALIPNGCDPERFSPESKATGATTIGYIGKIGSRLDIDLIRRVTAVFPRWNFLFAGPVLERQTGHALTEISNVKLLGDVQYRNIPTLLTTFDVGWVPHGVEEGQVGGDAIKIYEYRAAALPVLTTPIIGTLERPQEAVHVLPGSKHADFLASLDFKGSRVPRHSASIPLQLTWKNKAETILNMLLSQG